MNKRAPQRSRHHTHRHQGKWILVDADLQHLWAIGTNLYPAHSASGSLDTIGRRGLLPALRAAVTTRHPIDRTIPLLGSTWRVRAIPLLGVVSNTPIGVLGTYDTETTELSEPPVVGTWEMPITPPGPGQQLHSHVSPQMYEAYGVPANKPRIATSQRIDTSQWKDDLLALADRPRSRAFFTMLLTDVEPELKFFDFTAAPPGTSERYALRCTGRRFDDNGRIWLRGLTFRRPSTPVPDAPRHLEAVLALSRDPIWMIDSLYEVVYLSTDNLNTHDLKKFPTRALADMCHADDLPALRAQLRWASTHLGRPSQPVLVRFALEPGGWRQLELQLAGVRIAGNITGVWCRVSAAP
ncbi:hypothetical protein [Actinophytocola glycyrrhizae]|uniref:Rv3651-like N-terminal domain-containing protein n=1 Tax=Actinophytocola glycyrrhizae TaxID=2044873 RepID=A0ABV9SFI5_9PSEU